MVDKAEAAANSTRAKSSRRRWPSRRAPTWATSTRATSRDLGPVLLPTSRRRGGDPALSPARSPLPTAPGLLLHGTDDNVVPAIESTLLARRSRDARLDVHLLLTPLITHAEVDRPRPPAASGS